MLVSVVIPSYNHKSYVLQAIESVLNQSWPHVDLIVIDDGSKDGSPEIIQRLLDQRGGFRFVARENRGLLKTLNEGLRLARGEFFCELASDDYFPPDSIEKRVRFLLEHPECVAVFGDGFRVVNDAVVDQSFLDEGRRQVLLATDPIPGMLEGKLPVFSSGLVRCAALKSISGFDDQMFRYYEDLDTPILLALEGRLGFIATQVICRRQHETNVSGTTHHIRMEKVRCFQKLLMDQRLRPYEDILKKQLRREFLKLGRYLVRSGGGTLEEKELFRQSRQFFLAEPRLVWYYAKMTLFSRP